MTGRPILNAIRAVLKFKDATSIPEVAKFSGKTQREVLDVINANGEFVSRFRKTGKIAKVDPQSKLRADLWSSGKYFKRESYGAWCHEGYCLKFEGNDELRKTLQRQRVTGGIGDSWTISIIEDNEENRQALIDAGLEPWESAVIDDRLWVEVAS